MQSMRIVSVRENFGYVKTFGGISGKMQESLLGRRIFYSGKSVF